MVQYSNKHRHDKALEDVFGIFLQPSLYSHHSSPGDLRFVLYCTAGPGASWKIKESNTLHTAVHYIYRAQTSPPSDTDSSLCYTSKNCYF